MKSLKTLLTLIVLPSILFAQSNYKPGYVVTSKGDTVKGFIDYREWDKNPFSFSFKKNAGDQNADKFSPVNANGFGIDGFEYYERYLLPVSQAQIDVSKLSVGVDTSTVVKNVFLRLVKGGANLNLYSYKDDIKDRFYIKEHVTNTPVELIYQQYLNPTEVTQIVTQPKYKNQLFVLAVNYHKNDNKLQAKIEQAEYIQTDLATIVNAINGTTGLKNKTPGANATRFFAGLGIVKGNLDYHGDITVAENSTGKSIYSPKLVFGMDAALNPNVGRLILRAEISLNSATYEIHTTQGLYASQQFHQFTGALSPQIIYNVYNTEVLKFYIDAGASVNFSRYTDNKYIYADEPYSGTTRQLDDYPKMANAWISFFGKIGVTFDKKYEVNLSYHPYAATTDHYISLSGGVSGIQAGVNYFFN